MSNKAAIRRILRITIRVASALLAILLATPAFAQSHGYTTPKRLAFAGPCW